MRNAGNDVQKKTDITVQCKTFTTLVLENYVVKFSIGYEMQSYVGVLFQSL